MEWTGLELNETKRNKTNQRKKNSYSSKNKTLKFITIIIIIIIKMITNWILEKRNAKWNAEWKIVKFFGVWKKK